LADRFCFVVKELGVEAIHDDRSRLNIMSASFQMLCEVLKVRYHLLFGLYSHPTPSYQAVAPASPGSVASTDTLGAASASSNRVGAGTGNRLQANRCCLPCNLSPQPLCFRCSEPFISPGNQDYT